MAHDKKTYALTYDRLAIEEFAALDVRWQEEARAAIERKLQVAPEIFGKPLRKSLKGCRALRIGDYRAVFQIHGDTVRILGIVHRSDKYRTLEKRL